LLFHMVRHALQLGYYGAAVKLHVAAGLVAAADVPRVYREPAFVHLAGAEAPSESRYALLYARAPAVTRRTDLEVARYIPAAPRPRRCRPPPPGRGPRAPPPTPPSPSTSPPPAPPPPPGRCA